MKAEVTISNIYWNEGLRDFFFRKQASDTLDKLMERSALNGPETLNALNDATDGMDIDDVEESFYSCSIDELAEEFSIELTEEEDEL